MGKFKLHDLTISVKSGPAPREDNKDQRCIASTPGCDIVHGPMKFDFYPETHDLAHLHEELAKVLAPHIGAARAASASGDSPAAGAPNGAVPAA